MASRRLLLSSGVVAARRSACNSAISASKAAIFSSLELIFRFVMNSCLVCSWHCIYDLCSYWVMIMMPFVHFNNQRFCECFAKSRTSHTGDRPCTCMSFPPGWWGARRTRAKNLSRFSFYLNHPRNIYIQTSKHMKSYSIPKLSRWNLICMIIWHWIQGTNTLK